MSDTTPVRGIGERTPEGYVLLRDVESTYRDGAEEDVYSIIHASTDISCGSDELIGRATTWPERYHLDPARANILRPLAIGPGMRVLEIGAGCGPISRYLGETGALVDSLEPSLTRARTARERCRDLDNVEVFVGEISDVPDVAAYDAVLVIGVLEYVAGGTEDRAPYLDFLAQIRSRLRENGSLVLAIENALGVKYLCGAPEDHTGRTFDSVEEYPRGTHARAFSRPDLESLMTDAGFDPNFFLAFPDYKLTRAVLAPVLPESAQSLLYRVPQFPSPDWTTPRPRLADERSLWRNLVRSGLAAEFGNSHLVVAPIAGAADPISLWPAAHLGEFYSTGRVAAFTTDTSIATAGGEVSLQRTVRGAGSRPDCGVTIDGSTAALVKGEDVVDVMAGLDDAGIAELLRRWIELLDAEFTVGKPAPLDLVPHNLVLDEAGQLVVIDREWLSVDVTRDGIVRRGIMWLASHLAQSTPPERWPTVHTIRELAVHLGTMVGLDEFGAWFEPTLTDEARLQSLTHAGRPIGDSDELWTSNIRATVNLVLQRKLVDLPLGRRADDLVAELREELATQATTLGARVAFLDQEGASVRAAAIRLQEENAALRALVPVPIKRRIARRLLPAGTTRRKVAGRVRRRLS